MWSYFRALGWFLLSIFVNIFLFYNIIETTVEYVDETSTKMVVWGLYYVFVVVTSVIIPWLMATAKE